MMHSQNGVLSKYGPLVARILMAILFLFSGIGKVTGFAGTVGYIDSVGIPMATVVAVLAIIVELAGALFLLIGWQGRLGAWLLFAYTGLAAVLFHTNFADQTQMVMFLKNLSIMGGLLMFALKGTGPLSVGCTCCGKYCLDCKNCEQCKDRTYTTHTKQS